MRYYCHGQSRSVPVMTWTQPLISRSTLESYTCKCYLEKAAVSSSIAVMMNFLLANRNSVICTTYHDRVHSRLTQVSISFSLIQSYGLISRIYFVRDCQWIRLAWWGCDGSPRAMVADDICTAATCVVSLRRPFTGQARCMLTL